MNPITKLAMDFSLSNLNTLAGVFLILSALFYISWKSLTSKIVTSKRTMVPEARGAWPIIGHLHLLGGSRLPHVTLGAMADKHGPIFTLRLGAHRAIVVSNWEMAKECFTTNDLAASSRPKLLAAKHFSYNYAMFGFSPYGPYWRELRKISSVELLSGRRLELLKHVLISETCEFVKELYKLWGSKRSSSKGHALVEMKELFGDFSLKMVLRIVVGKQGVGVEDKKKAERCKRAIREFCRLMGVFVVGDTIPYLRWLDLGGHEKAMKRSAKEFDLILREWLEEHKQERDSGEVTSKGEKDFMGVMLRVLDGVELAGYDADTINKATCMNMILGGIDTTTVTLTWIISLLLNNCHVLKKAQEELDINVGKDRRVKEFDISKLVYLQAIVKETFRLYPVSPLGGPREFTEDCTVGKYHVPGGMRLVVNLWKLQRDSRVWPEPLEFKPERFLTTHKNLDVKGQNFELMPFGAGRRMCPGTALALQVLHLVLASILHGFDISRPSDEPIDMTESPGLTNKKATPLDVLLMPRLSSDLY